MGIGIGHPLLRDADQSILSSLKMHPDLSLNIKTSAMPAGRIRDLSPISP
jgi:hypothetical protein